MDLADSEAQTDVCLLVHMSIQTIEVYSNASNSKEIESVPETEKKLSCCILDDEQKRKLATTGERLADLQQSYVALQQQYDDTRETSGDHLSSGILSRTAVVIQRHMTDFGGLMENHSEKFNTKASRISLQMESTRNLTSVLAKEFRARERLLQEIVARDAESASCQRQIAALKMDLAGQNSGIGRLHQSLSTISGVGQWHRSLSTISGVDQWHRSLSTISGESDDHEARHADLEANVTALSDVLLEEQGRNAMLSSENASLRQKILIVDEEVRESHGYLL